MFRPLVNTVCCFFFFFNDTATTEIYTLSLHDALPIWVDLVATLLRRSGASSQILTVVEDNTELVLLQDELSHQSLHDVLTGDRKSTRLNSSHANISYAVFCLKKKKI